MNTQKAELEGGIREIKASIGTRRYNRSTWIAVASLLIAIGSLVVTILVQTGVL
jgi:hypothetical protein